VVVPGSTDAAAAAGLLGVYASARLYVVPGRPAWDSPLTIVRFLATTAATGPLLTGHAGVAAVGVVAALAATAANWWRLSRSDALTHAGSVRLELRRFRWWTVGRFVLGGAALLALGVPLLALALVVAAELIGRWLFFVTVVPMNMPGSFFR
jgi:DMSO reductase anchor subunit